MLPHDQPAFLFYSDLQKLASPFTYQVSTRLLFKDTLKTQTQTKEPGTPRPFFPSFFLRFAFVPRVELRKKTEPKIHTLHNSKSHNDSVDSPEQLAAAAKIEESLTRTPTSSSHRPHLNFLALLIPISTWTLGDSSRPVSSHFRTSITPACRLGCV